MKRFLMTMVVSLLLLGGMAQADEPDEMHALRAQIESTMHDLKDLDAKLRATDDPAERMVLEEQVKRAQQELAVLQEHLEKMRLERVQHAEELAREGEATYHRAREAMAKALAMRDQLKMKLAMLEHEGKVEEVERVRGEADHAEEALARYRHALDLVEEAKARGKAGRLEAAREALERARHTLETVPIRVEIEQECRPTVFVDGDVEIEGTIDTDESKDLQRKVKEIEVRIAEARKHYTEMHPEMIRLRVRAKELHRRLLELRPPPIFKVDRLKLGPRIRVKEFDIVEKGALRPGLDFHEITRYAGRRNPSPEEAEAHERLEHLREAAHHLHEAGAHEGAERIEQEIREIEEHLERMRMERRHREHGEHPEHAGVHPHVMEAIEGLRHEVKALREEVRELKEILLERRAR